MARHAEFHSDVVVANIRKLAEGRYDLVTYEPHADEIVLPLGPDGGVSYAVEAGVLGSEVTAEIKANFFLDIYLEQLGGIART